MAVQLKILAFDHNKDHLVDWTKAMMTELRNTSGADSSDGKARVMSPYVDGMVSVYNCLDMIYFSIMSS